MHQIHDIQSSFQPFFFITEIEEISKDFEKIENESQAITLRSKLNKLSKKPYFKQLNQHQIHHAIQQGLLYLAHHYPINDEDPISLDNLNQENSITISTGHRFEVGAFLPYFKRQSWFELKNPFTNEVMSRADAIRIIEALEKKYPEEFKSTEATNNKELLLWSHQVKQKLSIFLEKSDEVQVNTLEMLLGIQIKLLPIIDYTLLHFVLMNYCILIKKVEIPEIKSGEARILLFSNALSLLVNHYFLEYMLKVDLSLAHNFRYRLISNLVASSHLIGMDLFFGGINYLFSTVLRAEDSLKLQSLQTMLFCYGFYMVCLNIKSPKSQFSLQAGIAALEQLLVLYISSHFLKSIFFSGFYMMDNGSDPYQLAIADSQYYFPLAIIFYMYISELVKLSTHLQELIHNDRDNTEFEQALEEVLAQPFQI